MESYCSSEVIFVHLSNLPIFGLMSFQMKSICFFYSYRLMSVSAIQAQYCHRNRAVQFKVSEHMQNLQANSVSFKIFTDTN